MRNFLANLSLRDQAITLALLSSGQDSGDLFNLNIADVEKQTKNGRIYWASRRNKTAIPFKTFISREATKLIRRYVEQERVEAKDNDPLFVFTTRQQNQKQATVERMTSDYLGWVYRDVAKKMKIEWKEDEATPLRPKRMRHLFRTACDTAGLQEIYVNAFMGHKNHLA
jgi:integrase